MPIREYECLVCGTKVESLIRSEVDVPAQCSQCGGGLQQCFSFPGTYFINGDNSASQRPRKSKATE